MKKKIKAKIKNTEDYLRVLNGLFNLTDKEIIILAAFIDKQEELKDTGIDVFSAEAKRLIAEGLDIDDFNVLNVYIKRLKEKKAIRKVKGTYEISPLLVKMEDETGVEILWQTKRK